MLLLEGAHEVLGIERESVFLDAEVFKQVILIKDDIGIEASRLQQDGLQSACPLTKAPNQGLRAPDNVRVAAEPSRVHRIAHAGQRGLRP